MTHYVETYDNFWKDLVEIDGRMDLDKVMRELADYSVVLEEVSKAYVNLTDGRISKPNASAHHVVNEASNSADRQFVRLLVDELLPELDPTSSAYEQVVVFAKGIDSEEFARLIGGGGEGAT